MNNLAPILLFVYNRPEHTLETLEALKSNDHASKSELIIYSDGPASDDTGLIESVSEVRKIIRAQSWCNKLTIFESENNKGLADSVIKGVSEVFKNYNKAIILEDDIVTSKGFLKFMNEALSLYEENERIASITGYLEPGTYWTGDIMFASKGSSWGWGTWKRVWQTIEFDSQTLYDSFESKDIPKFNYAGYPYYEMLNSQVKGQINSWAIRFYASCFLQGRLHIVPSKSLVRNIGFDGSGIHCEENQVIQKQSIANSQFVKNLPVRPNRILPNLIWLNLKIISLKSRIFKRFLTSIK